MAVLCFVYSSAGGHLGFFHLLATMNNAVINMHYVFLSGHTSSFLLGVYPGVGLVGL